MQIGCQRRITRAHSKPHHAQYKLCHEPITMGVRLNVMLNKFSTTIRGERRTPRWKYARPAIANRESPIPLALARIHPRHFKNRHQGCGDDKKVWRRHASALGPYIFIAPSNLSFLFWLGKHIHHFLTEWSYWQDESNKSRLWWRKNTHDCNFYIAFFVGKHAYRKSN